jgi:hypothetical protein
VIADAPAPGTAHETLTVRFTSSVGANGADGEPTGLLIRSGAEGGELPVELAAVTVTT